MFGTDEKDSEGCVLETILDKFSQSRVTWFHSALALSVSIHREPMRLHIRTYREFSYASA